MHQTAVYLIRIAGPLAADEASWFEDLTVDQTSLRETSLVTPAIDQTTLHGILATLRDLAIPLIAVQQISPPNSR